MSSSYQRIADNVARVRGRIAEAAERSGRDKSTVTLVAVTKYVGTADVEALLAVGCRELGESRPQELWAKVAALEKIATAAEARWHQIGHLQRNKVGRTVPLVTLVHAVDSVRLIRSIHDAAQGLHRSIPILLETNISGDQSKHGFTPDELKSVIEQLPEFPGVETRGLMGMASLAGGRDQAKRDFVSLRLLRDGLLVDCPESVSLAELSMGMSRDYDIAVAEGATIVRVGSTLFEGLDH